MIKFWRIIAYEYKRNVFRWQFIVSLMSVPFFVFVFLCAMFLSAMPELNTKPVGYVDLAGLFPNQEVKAQDRSTLIEFIPFDNEKQAAQALNAGDIQGYYVLEEDYLNTRRAQLVSQKPPGVLAQSLFAALVRAQLISRLPMEISERVENPGSLQVRSLDGKQQISSESIISYFAPIITSFILLIIAYSTSSYLMRAILEEKANRTMEILISSVSPWQLLVGKTIGLTCVGLTQLLFWASPLTIFFFLGSAAGIGSFAGPTIISDSVFFIFLTIFPSFMIIASIMTTVGVLVADEREGQLISSLVIIPPYIPIFLYRYIIENPNSSLTKALGYFPLTATTTMSVRAVVAPIPREEMALTLLILLFTMLGMFWLAGFTWRLGMLNYGRRINWRKLFGRVGKQSPKGTA